MTYDAAYQKRWRHDRHNGIRRTIPTDEVRLHIASLLGSGLSLRSIAAAASTSPTVTSNINRGGQERCKPDLARRILAVQPGIIREASTGTTEPFVSKVGAVRRIQALLAIGWTHAHQHQRCGVRTHLILSQQGRWVTLATFEAIERLYDELSMTSGPSAKTKGRAQKLGYLPPLMWDDIDLDQAPAVADEASRPEHDIDDVAVQRAMNGDRSVALTKSEREEITRRWVASGRPLNELERVTGINPHRYLHKESA